MPKHNIKRARALVARLVEPPAEQSEFCLSTFAEYQEGTYREATTGAQIGDQAAFNAWSAIRPGRKVIVELSSPADTDAAGPGDI